MTNFLLLGMLLVTASADAFSSYKTLPNLRQYLANETTVTDNNSSSSTQCFPLYLPLLQDVANQWSTDYDVCLNNATAQRHAIEKNYATLRATMTTAANGITAFIATCLNATLERDFFDCFANFATSKLATVYEISFNASDATLSLTHELNDIDYGLYQCTNQTENSYLRQTAQVYDALDACLQLGPPEIDANAANGV